MVNVLGRLRIRDWNDKDGNKRRSAEIIASNVYFADSPKEKSDSQKEKGEPNHNAPADFIPDFDD